MSGTGRRHTMFWARFTSNVEDRGPRYSFPWLDSMFELSSKCFYDFYDFHDFHDFSWIVMMCHFSWIVMLWHFLWVSMIFYDFLKRFYMIFNGHYDFIYFMQTCRGPVLDTCILYMIKNDQNHNKVLGVNARTWENRSNHNVSRTGPRHLLPLLIYVFHMSNIFKKAIFCWKILKKALF